MSYLYPGAMDALPKAQQLVAFATKKEEATPAKAAKAAYVVIGYITSLSLGDPDGAGAKAVEIAEAPEGAEAPNGLEALSALETHLAVRSGAGEVQTSGLISNLVLKVLEKKLKDLIGGVLSGDVPLDDLLGGLIK